MRRGHLGRFSSSLTFASTVKLVHRFPGKTHLAIRRPSSSSSSSSSSFVTWTFQGNACRICSLRSPPRTTYNLIRTGLSESVEILLHSVPLASRRKGLRATGSERSIGSQAEGKDEMALLLKRVRIPLLCNQIEIEGEEERKEDSPSFSRLGLEGKDEGEILSDRMPTELKCSEDVVRVLDFCRKTVDGEPSLSPDFDIEKFEACLSKAEPPTPMPESEENQSSLWNVLAGRQVASTQTILSENASKLPSKCIVIADQQTQGKGNVESFFEICAIAS